MGDGFGPSFQRSRMIFIPNIKRPFRVKNHTKSGEFMCSIRVVVVDDHPVVRSNIRRILQRAPGIDVIGEASNGLEAINQVSKLNPDVLLLDMEMPVLNGIEVARRLHSGHSTVRILALSAYDDKQYILELLANGAAGYLTKDEAPQFIVEAVERVARGEQGGFSKRAKARLNYISQPNKHFLDPLKDDFEW